MKNLTFLFVAAGLWATVAAAQERDLAGSPTTRFVETARTMYSTPAFAAYTNTIVNLFVGSKEDMLDSPRQGDLVRWILVPGARNVRDIGGWTGLQKGRVYRGTELNEVGGHKLQIGAVGKKVLLKDLGIRTDLDFRVVSEKARGACVTQSALGPDVQLVDAVIRPYMRMYDQTNEYAAVLRLFADEKSYPVYMHCWGGADRTGTVAFILEGLCGASETDITIDYELTSFAIFGLRTRMNRGSATFADVMARMKTYPGATLAEKFASYARDTLGLTDAEIAAIRKNLCPAAIDAGSRLQVMWDDHVVDTEKTTASRIVHHPELVGPAMTHERPWEGDGSDYHCIVPDHDGRGDFLRMYYNGIAIECGWKDVKTRFSADGVRICYAESRDGGLTWTKPSLGIVEFRGSKDNNCILDKSSFGSEWDNFMVFKDENPSCPPDELYKGIGEHKGGLWCFLSSDGLHFRKGWKIEVAGAFDSLNVAIWDKMRGEYHLYFRGLHNPKDSDPGRWSGKWDNNDIRDIRHSVSKDFKTWTTPKLIDFGEGVEDYPLYTNLIQPYFREPSIYVGFPSRYMEHKEWTPNFDRLPSPEKRRWRMDKAHGGQRRYGLTVTDCVFIFSRDGQRFFREDEAFMRPGPETPDNWVYGDAYPAYRLIKTPSPVGGGDEISMFAFDRHWSGLAETLYRYRLRQDGFISRHASYAGQKVVTKPLVFAGDEMLVNFSTSARGRMFVTLRDEAGKSIRSVALFGDKVDRPVDFADGGKVSDFAGRPVTVTFEMSDADLYSFRFRK